jgi:hypothetical protein
VNAAVQEAAEPGVAPGSILHDSPPDREKSCCMMVNMQERYLPACTRCFSFQCFGQQSVFMQLLLQLCFTHLLFFFSIMMNVSTNSYACKATSGAENNAAMSAERARCPDHRYHTLHAKCMAAAAHNLMHNT